MSTLLFTLEYPPFKGGVANYYEQLVKAWPLAASDLGFSEKLELLHLEPHRSPLQYLQHFFYLARAVKKYQVKHILVGQILPLGSSTHFFCRFKRINYSVFLHGMDLSLALQNRRKARLAKLILTDAKLIICANSYTANLTRQAWPQLAAKIIIVNPGVDNFLNKQENLQLVQHRALELQKEYALEGRELILSLGRLVARKGFDRAILAYQQANLGPNWAYVVLGSGPDEARLKQLAAGRRDIIFINQVTDLDKWAWFLLSAFFVMPARDIDGDFEGFGIVYLEANLASRSVLAGRSGGVEDAVINEKNGLLVNPEDEAEIRAGLIRLAGDAVLRQTLGSSGKERALLEFNWQHQAQIIIKALQ